MKTIYFITGNKGKVREAQKKFSNLDIKLVQKDLGYPEIQVEKLEDVAIYGAEHVSKKLDQPFILEDAGLFIESLKGFPGVYSADVFYAIGCEGILKLMADIPDSKRKAVFKSVFAYTGLNGKTQLFIGECKGKISKEKRGKNGFGYDPIFIPNESSKTFAEMQTDEKNQFSHRGRSLEKLIDFLKKI